MKTYTFTIKYLRFSAVKKKIATESLRCRLKPAIFRMQARRHAPNRIFSLLHVNSLLLVQRSARAMRAGWRATSRLKKGDQ